VDKILRRLGRTDYRFSRLCSRSRPRPVPTCVWREPRSHDVPIETTNVSFRAADPWARARRPRAGGSAAGLESMGRYELARGAPTPAAKAAPNRMGLHHFPNGTNRRLTPRPGGAACSCLRILEPLFGNDGQFSDPDGPSPADKARPRRRAAGDQRRAAMVPSLPSPAPPDLWHHTPRRRFVDARSPVPHRRPDPAPVDRGSAARSGAMAGNATGIFVRRFLDHVWLSATTPQPQGDQPSSASSKRRFAPGPPADRSKRAPAARASLDFSRGSGPLQKPGAATPKIGQVLSPPSATSSAASSGPTNSPT